MVGLWKSIIKLLEELLLFFYRYTGRDYGVAVVLLTVAIRLLLVPLTVKQTKAVKEMQELQPKLKKLQEKYKDNKEKLQQEMLKFYAEHKVNPFSGCLPLLLQMPIMIALFVMLRTSDKLKEATSFLLGGARLDRALTDLAPILRFYEIGAHFGEALPYLVLLIILAGTNYYMSYMVTNDPQQQKLTLFMTLFMVYIGWLFPAGVLLYWTTYNILTIIQQYFTLQALEKAKVRK